MKTYQVKMRYGMEIVYKVKADYKTQAEEYARKEIDGLNNEEFLLLGRPQLLETEIEEI